MPQSRLRMPSLLSRTAPHTPLDGATVIPNFTGAGEPQSQVTGAGVGGKPAATSTPKTSITRVLIAVASPTVAHPPAASAASNALTNFWRTLSRQSGSTCPPTVLATSL